MVGSVRYSGKDNSMLIVLMVFTSKQLYKLLQIKAKVKVCECNFSVVSAQALVKSKWDCFHSRSLWSA